MVSLSNGEKIRAAGDGELLAQKLERDNYQFHPGQPVILLEAQKRGGHITSR